MLQAKQNLKNELIHYFDSFTVYFRVPEKTVAGSVHALVSFSFPSLMDQITEPQTVFVQVAQSRPLWPTADELSSMYPRRNHSGENTFHDDDSASKVSRCSISANRVSNLVKESSHKFGKILSLRCSNRSLLFPQHLRSEFPVLRWTG